MPLNLHLGCGDLRLPNHVNIDIRISTATDVVRDVLRGLPYADSTVDTIRSENFLEHLPQSEAIWIMNEMWRVLRPGGIAYHQIPMAGTTVDYQDPTHLSRWHPETFTYFELHHARQRYYPNIKPWTIHVDIILPNQILDVTMRKPE
jgi:predicted SAM-dependent methyltransferase